MRPFGWKKWGSLYLGFKKSKRHSIERWGLVYLHSNYALNELAYLVAKVLGKSGKSCEISVETIWIDGTPQAEAKSFVGTPIKCELADLLFILEEKDIKGAVIRETGLLIQGKATPKYNKLTSGSSTKKERQLLEGMDRSKPIVLYKATNSLTSSIIGTYNLGGIPVGLSDCSRYLLMPKQATWINCHLRTYAPFQVGWPKSNRSPYLRAPQGMVEAIQRMVLSGNGIGKKIVDPTKCEWSRLVKDLRGNYFGTHMVGYGGQPRVNTSSDILSFTLTSHIYTSNPLFGGFYPPTINRELLDVQENTPPLISVVKMTIRDIDARINE